MDDPALGASTCVPRSPHSARTGHSVAKSRRCLPNLLSRAADQQYMRNHPMTLGSAAGQHDPDFDQVLRTRSVRAVFQPLIDLDSGETVGFEALGRGPAGSRWESPAALFGEAYRVGRVSELDWSCRAAAFSAATAANLHPSLSLFVNMEPVSVGTSCPPDLRSTVDSYGAVLRVVMEVTERAVAADPAGLLAE